MIGRYKEIENKVKRHDEIIKKLKTDLKDLEAAYNEKLKRIKEDQQNFKEAVTILDNTTSKNYKTFFSKRLEEMAIGTFALTADDYFQFWTDLHMLDKISYFKVVSRILPSYWNEPEMQLYEMRQIENIKLVKNENGKNVPKWIGTMLDEIIGSYSPNILRNRTENFFESNFERIFIIDSKWTDDQIEVLKSVIKRQLNGGINVRVLPLKINELSTFKRPQDFGVVVTSTGDVFGMFCDVDKEGHPLGGLIIKNEKEISHYLDCYLRLRGKSTKIENAQMVGNISSFRPPVDISDPELYGNRCYHCLVNAEKKIENNLWQNEKTALKTWYEIVYYEQQALTNFLTQLDLKSPSILELGTGPGRVINLIFKLLRSGKIRKPKQIVGYEQNSEIAGYCTDSFRGSDPPVTIHTHFVGFHEGRFMSIRPTDRNTFDLIIAVSNLVGWQDDNEVEWITHVIQDGLKVDGILYCTVYKKGCELERARMYKASGDIIEFDKKTSDITLIPTFRRTAKIEQQNTGESIGYDVTNRNIASLQCPDFTPMTYGHERRYNYCNRCF